MYVLRKRDFDDTDVGAGKGIGEERTISRSGEDGDGDIAAEKKTSKIKDRNCVAFGHEREHNNMDSTSHFSAQIGRAHV